MGSNSLDSGAHLAQAVSDFDVNPDLDDALVHQALSVYQANRDRKEGAIGCFPSRSSDLLARCAVVDSEPVAPLDKYPIHARTRIEDGHKLEIIVDLPANRHGPFLSADRIRSNTTDKAWIFDDLNADPEFVPQKPYACASFHKPRPIDEKIVACSSRIKVEEVPIFGCAKRIKIDIDLPDFYLCSANIRLKPDWTNDDGPRHDHLCVARPGHWPKDIYACINTRPIDGSKPKGGDYYACAAIYPIDGSKPKGGDYYACAAIYPIDGSNPKGGDYYACAAIRPIDWSHPKGEVTLCASKIEFQPHDFDNVNACVAKFKPYEPREKDERARVDSPESQIIGCGRKVPGEPGFYRFCSATQPKQYIPEFLEYELNQRAILQQQLKNGVITQEEYDKRAKS